MNSDTKKIISKTINELQSENDELKNTICELEKIIENIQEEYEKKLEEKNEQDSHDLIKHLRKAEQEWYSNNDYDGAYWRVNIEVNELDGSFETTLKKIIDEGRR